MNRSFSCTFLTDTHKLDTERYAREYKHMTLSEFARFAMNEYIKKYPDKVIRALEGAALPGDAQSPRVVQPYASEAKSTQGVE